MAGNKRKAPLPGATGARGKKLISGGKLAVERKKVNWEKTEVIATLSTKSNGDTLELNRVAWGEYAPKYDIRRWGSRYGEIIPMRGCSLNLDELCALRDALNAMQLPGGGAQ